MIHNVTAAVAALLQEHLGGVKIQEGPLGPTPELPAVGIYAGKFVIEQPVRDVLPTPQEEGKEQTLTLQSEFRQELLLDAHGANAGEAEKWASLAASVILGCAKELLQTIDAPNPGYSAGSFKSLHFPEQLRLLEGSPSLLDNVWVYRLRFNVLGRLRLVRLLPERRAVISEVVIKQELG